MKLVRFGFVVSVLLIPSMASAQQLIPDRISCPACTVRFERVAVLGDSLGPGELNSTIQMIRKGNDQRY